MKTWKYFALLLLSGVISACQKEDTESSENVSPTSTGVYTGTCIIQSHIWSGDSNFYNHHHDTVTNLTLTVYTMSNDSAIIAFSPFSGKGDDSLSINVQDQSLSGKILLTNNPMSQTSTYSYDFNLNLVGNNLTGTIKHSWAPASNHLLYNLDFTK